MLVPMSQEQVLNVASELEATTLAVLAYFELRDVYYDKYISWHDPCDGESTNPWTTEAKLYYALRDALGLKDDDTKANLALINALAKTVGR